MVYPNVEYFGKIKGRCDHGDYSYDSLIWYNMIVCTCLYRRSDFDKTVGYNSNMKYGYEDWDFLLSLLKPEDSVVRLDDTLFYYRIKSKSMGTQMGPHLEYTLRQIVKNHPDIYRQHIDDVLLDKRMAGYYKSSLPYRLGLKLLYPYRKIKQLLCKRYYQDV